MNGVSAHTSIGMEVPESVPNVLNRMPSTLLTYAYVHQTKSRGHKRHREFDFGGDDNERDVPGEYVKQLESQPIRYRYVQRACKRAAAPAGAAPVGAAAAGAIALVGSTSQVQQYQKEMHRQY